VSEAAGVRRVAVVGTSTIGASWTALFLAPYEHLISLLTAPR
jgi:hypothetical protein